MDDEPNVVSGATAAGPCLEAPSWACLHARASPRGEVEFGVLRVPRPVLPVQPDVPQGTPLCSQVYRPDEDVAHEEAEVERLMLDAATADGSMPLPLIVARKLRKRYAGARTSAVQVPFPSTLHVEDHPS
jgi:hypothetical protein